MNLPDYHRRLPGVDFESLAFHDYGARRWKDAPAVIYHGAESAVSDPWAVSNYLRKEHGPNPTGVSATFVVESDGKVGQMLGLNRVSGSINETYPRPSGGRGLCETESPPWGASHAKGVLGDRWRYPNSACISVEMGMRAKNGPNDKVIEGAVRLFGLLLKVYPNIVPLAHADYANCYKSCPGKTDRIKRMFALMGGHGLDYKRPEARRMSTITYRDYEVATVTDGAKMYDYPGGDVIGVVEATSGLDRKTFGTSPDKTFRLIFTPFDGNPRTAWIRSVDVDKVAVVPPPECPECPPGDCTECEAQRDEAIKLAKSRRAAMDVAVAALAEVTA